MSTTCKQYEVKKSYVDATTQTTGDSENKAIIKKTQHYFNNHTEDIVVLLRNNLPMRIKAGTGGKKSNTFVIRDLYVIKTNIAIVQLANDIKEWGEHNKIEVTDDLEIIRGALQKYYEAHGNYGAYIGIGIDRTVDTHYLKEHEVLYEPSSDVLMMYKTLYVDRPHPYSTKGLAVDNYASIIQNKKGYCVLVEIVDNENNIGDRYMYVAKKMITIPVTKDPSRTSGVHFTSGTYEQNDISKLESSVLTVEAAEKEIGVYKTKELAQTGGSPEHEIKLQLTESLRSLETEKISHQKESLRLKSDFERKNSEYQHSLLEQKEHISKLEHSLEEFKKRTLVGKERVEVKRTKREDLYSRKDLKRKLKNARRDDYYEHKSHERKDTSEIIKFIPPALLGAAAVFAYNRS